MHGRGHSTVTRGAPGWLAPALLVGFSAALLLAESRRPLRPYREPGLRRWGRNLAAAVLAASAGALVEAPVADACARMALRRRWGLLNRIPLPGWIRIALSVALLDYTLYLWHVLTHRQPLWRLHQVHHVDLDLDTSTALRFHFAEILASVPYRAAQVVFIGVRPPALALWRNLLLASILFHHSNLRLPVRLERPLSRLIVTPRMHGIHHSTIPSEIGSNWSSGLTLWDALHRTLRYDVPQDEIEIGLPAYRDPKELRLADVLTMPFRRYRPSWTYRDGTPARRRRRLRGELQPR